MSYRVSSGVAAGLPEVEGSRVRGRLFELIVLPSDTEDFGERSESMQAIYYPWCPVAATRYRTQRFVSRVMH